MTMAKKLFDDLMKVIRSNVIFDGTTIVSQEVDLELPRGFVAKIKMVYLEVEGWELDTVGETNSVGGAQQALVRDPDDSITTFIPDNEVQHDVICDLPTGLTIDALATKGNTTIGSLDRRFDFENMGLDVITARNLRHNCVADNAIWDVAIGKCTIYYTLEAIKEDDILALLDIL